eukprot:scaffold8516_cov69-Phaeocystis_antarctica.AAC.2
MVADSMGADGFPRSGLEAGGVSLEEAGMHGGLLARWRRRGISMCAIETIYRVIANLRRTFLGLICPLKHTKEINVT